MYVRHSSRSFRYFIYQTTTKPLNCSTKCLREISSLSQTQPFLFSSIIRASTEKGSPQKALLDYKTILLSGLLQPNLRTLASVLESCKISLNLEMAIETHARIIKSGYELHPSLSSPLIAVYLAYDRLMDAHRMFDEMPEWGFDVISANLLIAGYLKIGDFENANRVFNKMPNRDVVSWNSIIGGCVRNARPKEAISLFRRMLNLGFEPDGFTFSSVFSACARVGALNHGEWAHGLMIEKEIELNFILSSALIDMYSKCGRIKTAMEVFDVARRDDVSIWNSMITGLAIHGLGSDVIAIFSRMNGENITPDSVTFVGVLTACSHCGLVEMGRHYFNLMKSDYSIEPQLEHYGAMVDLLGRSGLLEEAHRMIRAMPIEPDIVIWRSLLSACRTYGRPDLGEVVIERMTQCGSGDYVLLSNIYSSANRWDCAERVRELMKRRGVQKNRGLSWVETGGAIHEFKAGDRSHMESDAIYRVLDGLMVRIKAEGFVPLTGLVLMDVSEEEKEGNLNSHSEKLALAFAVLRTGPRSEIRVSKNLRTCCDCHCWMKMVSRMLCRVIIVRDRIRFHRFENGLCSCTDYW
ncbi:pentatricopeptide repeat-containing protein At5g50990 [Magnolia sinica]|uniref:pentatricopeptide repeat-containing protein At5g50990 n=1 Tax=Magnolia sinica TaxID=86752 RepID=UPI00265A9A14|nr:pentatricopeptide repeat-containing protein At5g50990 [Magnolia sinica]XP_058102890.1 pentatricopeptide repeat-containing protein At5g50990 [Magnolia sinica]